MFYFKNNEKIIFIFLIIFLFLSPLVNAEKNIEFWTINLSPSYDDYFNTKIAEFENQNPDFKIIWKDISFSSINQQFRYRADAGNPPAVVNLSPQLMVSLLEEDLLYPISKLKKDYSQYYYPLLWENGYYQGEYYAFPWYISSKLMAYNKEIFKIAGIDTTKNIDSQSELFKIAEKITAKTGVYGLMPKLKIHHEFLEAGIKLFKKEEQSLKAAFNTRAAEKIIKEYQELRKKGVIPRDSISSGFNIALERYMKNNLAILFTAPQFIKNIKNESKYLKEKTGLASIPAAEEGVINSPLMNLAIAQNADFKEKAAEFAAFITSAESQSEFTEESSVLSSAIKKESPLNQKSKNEINNKEINLEMKAKVILEKQLTRNQDLTLIHSQADELVKIMDEEFARAFLGKITSKRALNNMENKWNEILSEENNND